MPARLNHIFFCRFKNDALWPNWRADEYIYIDSHNRAHEFVSPGFQAQALAVTADPEHQFDLALHLGDLKTAAKVAENPAVCTEEKWKQLAEVATRQCDFSLAQHCLHQVLPLLISIFSPSAFSSACNIPCTYLLPPSSSPSTSPSPSPSPCSLSPTPPFLCSIRRRILVVCC